MAARQKRTISLPADLNESVEAAAAELEMSVSDWLAEAAVRHLQFQNGWTVIAEWEDENGTMSDAELFDGLRRARAILARGTSTQKSA